MTHFTAEKRLSRSRVRRPARNAATLPSSTLSLSTISGFHRIDAADRVVFTFSGGWTDGAVVLVLRNNNNRNSLAYKVKTTSNRLIRIRPARGLLSPESEISVQLNSTDVDGLRKMKETGVEPVIVVSAVCADDDTQDVVEAWREADTTGAPMWKKSLPVLVITKEPEKENGDEEMMEEEGNEEAMDGDEMKIEEMSHGEV